MRLAKYKLSLQSFLRARPTPIDPLIFYLIYQLGKNS